MGRWGSLPGRLTGPGVLLALLALLLNAIVPTGFMVDRGPAGAAIVICTGHGPQTLNWRADVPSRTRGHATPHHDACPFAGHGVTAGPAFVAILTGRALPSSAPNAKGIADLVPGRGLAAPPPPPRGPPLS